MSGPYTALTIAPSSLPTHPSWPALHAMINAAYAQKSFSVFPPTWSRLPPDPTKGAHDLATELGPQGLFTALLDADGNPAACSGALPFRGDNWIAHVESPSSADVAIGDIAAAAAASTSQEDAKAVVPDWETCCFCVHPSYRGQGLARRLLDEVIALIKPHGAKRLVSNYAVDETGEFWTKLGFEVIPGAGGMLKKGFQTDPEKEGLRADVHFKMGAKTI